MQRIKDIFRHGRSICTLAACLILFLTGRGQTQEVVAVLSSDLEPYVQAFEGFQEVVGVPVARFLLPSEAPEIRRETRVVVAFGGKAALRDYPEGVTLICCLAPGVHFDPGLRRSPVVTVHMHPSPEVILTWIRDLQPGLKRLAVLWGAESMEEDVRALRQSAGAFGVEVLSERATGSDDLPERLRAALRERADGLWVTSDPLLINARNISVIREFCWSNDIPMYVPTAGLVDKGAVASISSSFSEIGRSTGRVARQALSGRPPQVVVYPEEVEVVINLTAATQVGLQVPPPALSRASKVLP